MKKDLLLTLTKKELELFKEYDYDKNTIIFQENDECKYLGIILEGNIKISSYSYSGNEIIYNELGPKDLFGNNLLVSSYPLYKGNIIAINHTRIALIDKKSLITLLQENETFLNEYLKIMADNTKALNDKIKLLSFNNIEERFFYFMKMNNNKLYFSSITALANKLFIRRETLSRLISSLQKQHKIIKKENMIITK